MIPLFLICISLENELSVWICNSTARKGVYIFESVRALKIGISDGAAVSVSNTNSAVEVNRCEFSEVTSNSGSCCFSFVSKKVNSRNSCFYDLFPSYSDGSNRGGCCFYIDSASISKIEFLSIFNISSTVKILFATIQHSNSNGILRDVNQTKCSCIMHSLYASGFYYQNSISNDAFVKMIDSSGDFIIEYFSANGNYQADNFCFTKCSSSSGLIRSNVYGHTLRMNSCIVKSNKGPIIKLESGSSILDGWYSDTKLPQNFLNPKNTEFEIPIRRAECDFIPNIEKDYYDNSMHIRISSFALIL